MKKLKNLKSTYYLPTPVFWRKVGDSLLACSTFITTYAIYEDYKSLAITALILGVVGKFLSNLFMVEEPIIVEEQQTPPTE